MLLQRGNVTKGFKPKLDYNYAFLMYTAHNGVDPKCIYYQSEKCNYNPNLVWINKIKKKVSLCAEIYSPNGIA